MAMKMTHISKTLLSIVCTLWGMSACSDDYNKYDDCPACNYYPVAVGNSTGTPVHAIGVEMDPHFFSQNITRNDGSKAEDWENGTIDSAFTAQTVTTGKENESTTIPNHDAATMVGTLQ